MKRILFSLIIAQFLFVLFSPVQAFAYSVTKATPSPTPKVIDSYKAIDSYELFWPLTPGKTVASNSFFLKVWKEDFKGMLLIGSPAKADYQLLIANKRLVEAEKLLKDSNGSAYLKSLELVLKNVIKTQDFITEAKKKGENVPSVKDNMLNRISNLKLFLPFLKEKSGDAPDKLINEISKKVEELETTLQK